MSQARIGLVDLRADDEARGGLIREAIDRVARSGKLILGSEVASFERSLAAHCGASQAIGVASGTDALLMSLLACGVAPGDVVVTTPFSFISTAEAIVRAGATPRFVDVDPETLCLCPAAVARYLECCGPGLRDPHTGGSVKLILPVHLYGRVSDLGRLGPLANDASIAMVHDAAQAVGARWRQDGLAQTGPACLSFYPTKNLGGWGDGGAVLSNDAELTTRLRGLRVHGMGPDGDYQQLGLNSRLDAIQAAVLAVKLKHLPETDDKRRRNAEHYQTALSSSCFSGRIVPPPRLEEGDRCHLFTVRVLDAGRGRLRAQLEEAGIASGVYYPTLLFDHPAIAAVSPSSSADCRHARAACNEVLSLPVHEHLDDRAIDRVMSELQRWARVG